MKKYVKAEAREFNTFELGDVVVNVNSEDQLALMENTKELLQKYKILKNVNHCRIIHDKNWVTDKDESIIAEVFFTSMKIQPEFKAYIHTAGFCIDAKTCSENPQSIDERYLRLGQKLLDMIDEV